jgi:hypothetical protein
MQEEYEIGKEYVVPCAELRMKLDNKIFFIPIFNHLHADPQFGFKDQHYHIDARFYIEPRLLHQFNIKQGHTSAVIIPAECGSYTFLSIKLQRLSYVSNNTGITIPSEKEVEKTEKRLQYFAWYRSFVGKECEGKRCPHFGTAMLESGDLLVCPMHNLTADARTLKIININ